MGDVQSTMNNAAHRFAEGAFWPVRSVVPETATHRRGGSSESEASWERRANARGGYLSHVGEVQGQGWVLLPFGRRGKDILPLKKRHLFFRRTVDIVGSGALLIATAPLMMVAAVIVALTSRGRILFRHERIGRFGKPFILLKFRTMRTETHESVRSSDAYTSNDFKLDESDPRITRVGRFLRKSSIDELPQLFNVFRGDMSLVGVRPIVREQLMMRPEIDQLLYCRLRPGMTGLWQVSGRSQVRAQLRMAMDRHYAAGWTPSADLSILARTPSTLLRSDETG